MDSFRSVNASVRQVCSVVGVVVVRKSLRASVIVGAGVRKDVDASTRAWERGMPDCSCVLGGDRDESAQHQTRPTNRAIHTTDSYAWKMASTNTSAWGRRIRRSLPLARSFLLFANSVSAAVNKQTTYSSFPVKLSGEWRVSRSTSATKQCSPLHDTSVTYYDCR